MTSPDKAEIFAEVQRTLVELFQLDADKIHLGSGVFSDLDLDSIDAVDLVARLQDIIGQRITEQEMRQVRSVSDIVDLVYGYLQSKGAEASSVSAIAADSGADS